MQFLILCTQSHLEATPKELITKSPTFCLATRFWGCKALQACRDPKDLRDRKVSARVECRVFKELRGPKAQRGHKEFREVGLRGRKGLLETRECKDPTVPKGFRALSAIKDLRESTELKDLRAVSEHKELLVHKDLKETSEPKEFREPKDLKEFKELQEPKDLKELQDFKERKETSEPKDLKESQDFKERKETSEPKDLKELQDFKESLVYKGLKEFKDLKESLVYKGLKELKDLKENLECKVPKDFKDLKEAKDFKETSEHKVYKEFRETLEVECRVPKEFRASQELEHKVPKEFKDLRGEKEVVRHSHLPLSKPFRRPLLQTLSLQTMPLPLSSKHIRFPCKHKARLPLFRRTFISKMQTFGPMERQFNMVFQWTVKLSFIKGICYQNIRKRRRQATT